MSLADYKASRSVPLALRTVVLLFDGDRVLLGRKKSGFGEGYLVGIGGKVEADEAPEAAALREFREETGAHVDADALHHVAVLDFYFPHTGDGSWDQRVHVYVAGQHHGGVIETEEIEPEWFAAPDIPLHRMWDDARIWLPRVLAGHRLGGEFLFGADRTVVEHELADAGPPAPPDV